MEGASKGAGGRRGGERKKAVSKSMKSGLQFPVGRIARYLKKGRYAQRMGIGAPIYLAAVLELAGNAARDNKKNRINPRHLLLAVRNDDELGKLLQGVTIASGGVLPNIHPILLPKKTAASDSAKGTIVSISSPLRESLSWPWRTFQETIPRPSFVSLDPAQYGDLQLFFSRIGLVPSADISNKVSGEVGDGPKPCCGCLGKDTIANAAAMVGPAVVNLSVPQGSGTIIDSDGTILTCAHVVVDFQGFRSLSKGKVDVTLQDGRTFEGTVLNADLHSDIAIVKIKSKTPLPMAKLGTSSKLRPGDWVIAMGCPLSLQNTITAGIVSCVDRKSSDLGLGGMRREYLQTDCAINSGNSGGPLVNIDGEVIGVNIMKVLAADGLSFSVPIDSVSTIIEHFKKSGRVVRPWLGLKMLDLNDMIIAQLREKDPKFPNVNKGVLVPMVSPGSPADRAGFRPGDVVVEFEGRPVGSIKEITEIMGDKVGKPLKVIVKRANDTSVTLTVIPEEANPDIHHVRILKLVLNPLILELHKNLTRLCASMVEKRLKSASSIVDPILRLAHKAYGPQQTTPNPSLGTHSITQLAKPRTAGGHLDMEGQWHSGTWQVIWWNHPPESGLEELGPARPIHPGQTALSKIMKDFMDGSRNGMVTLENRVWGLERVVEDMARDLSISSGRRGSNFMMGFEGSSNRPSGKYNGFPDYSGTKLGRSSDGWTSFAERRVMSGGPVDGRSPKSDHESDQIGDTRALGTFTHGKNGHMASRRVMSGDPVDGRSPKSDHESDQIETTVSVSVNTPLRDSVLLQWPTVKDLRPCLSMVTSAQSRNGNIDFFLSRIGKVPPEDVNRDVSGVGDGSKSIATAVAMVAPAVVTITVPTIGLFVLVGMDGKPYAYSAGSGTIIDSDGTILTCAHLVMGSHGKKVRHEGKVDVALQNGQTFTGTVIYADLHTDIAIVKINSRTPFPAAKLGSSHKLCPGDWVVAMGCPLSFHNTITAGIVSCVDRKSSEMGLGGMLREYIQIDCATNPLNVGIENDVHCDDGRRFNEILLETWGNSGGPLFNLDGEVVGVVIMKLKHATGLNFAVPIDAVSKLMEQLKKNGYEVPFRGIDAKDKEAVGELSVMDGGALEMPNYPHWLRVVRPWLGLKMLDLNKMIIGQLKRRDAAFPTINKGVLVFMVSPGSPADLAGFQPGDVVIEFHGKPVGSIAEIVELMEDSIGVPFKVVVKRAKDTLVTLTVIPEEVNPQL
ncbi:hypothetical protein TEA_020688 [Camellia sinensis var. sinensis]|uniref:Histone H2A n=1 Tax=Camellia sinensis var. sinensis TaxID=542762 RepID=A0A4S4D849_CAMSN|nr:hypothetical protein TEA_020688 [Camellia sinensis var. sinensis]